jgi:hypothetical protein
MSLTQDDLAQIRTIVQEAVRPLESEIQALRSDIKEIYDIIAKLQKGAITDEAFAKLPLKEKLLKINAELLVAAKQAGITLPR